MSNYRNASFALQTSDLPLNGSNVYGSMDSIRTSFTWNNINLKTILGDLYDKYDMFNLDIVQIASNHRGGTAFGTTPSDRSVIVKISGLPFVNQTYNFKNACNTNVANLCAFKFPANTVIDTVNQSYNLTNLLTFSKNQEICNISISLIRVDNTPIISAFIAPDMVFFFTIHGIMDETNYSTNKRITF